MKRIKRSNKNNLEIEVISSEKGLHEIETDWNRLISKCKKPSIYSSFIFVKTAWEHFSELKRDHLFIILVKRKSEIIAIAPFRIETYNICYASMRVVRFISEWNGDRPGIITCEDENNIWRTIICYLENDFKDWDILDLAEQTCDCGLFDLISKNIKKRHSRIELETTSYYIKNMNWEEYQKNWSKNTRRMLKRKEKKFYSLSPKIEFQCYRDPDDIQDSFIRFVAIEKDSWKRGKPFTVGGKSYQRSFYQDLFSRFAKHKMISIYFLSVDGKDISGQIIYHFNNMSYSVQIAYRQEYADYSPGIVLEKMVLKHLLKSDLYHEIDMLGMQKRYGDQPHKKHLATNKRDTYRVRICRSNLRLFFLFTLNLCRMITSKILLNKNYRYIKQETNYLFPT